MLPMTTVLEKTPFFKLNHLVVNFVSNRKKRLDVRSVWHVQWYLYPGKLLTCTHPISPDPPTPAPYLAWLPLVGKNEQLPKGFLLTQNLTSIQEVPLWLLQDIRRQDCVLT